LVFCAVIVNFFGDRWVRLQVNGFLWTLLGCAARGRLLVQQAQGEACEEAVAVPNGAVGDWQQAIRI